MSSITTFTGKHIDPTQPNPEDIDIRDIAHALSLTCRGNGHVKTFYSVGQHCISCAREALARGYGSHTASFCLLHDASEAYMSDVPRPFKAHLTSYLAYEDRLLDVIYEKLIGRAPNEDENSVIRTIDNDLLWYDLKLLLAESPAGKAPKMYFDHDRSVRPFGDVEAEYLDLYNNLVPDV